PWQPDERAALAAADVAGVPIVGICFGAQSLACALGGGVRRAARPELGWVSVGTRVPERIADGPWFAWHDDELLAPPGAELLAAGLRRQLLDGLAQLLARLLALGLQLLLGRLAHRCACSLTVLMSS